MALARQNSQDNSGEFRAAYDVSRVLRYEPRASSPRVEIPATLEAMNQSLARKLAQTDRQIVEGIGLVVKQREIISEMERCGLDASESKTKLSTFLETLRAFVDYRDKMLRDLDGPRP